MFNNSINFDSKLSFSIDPIFDKCKIKSRVFHSNESNDQLFSNMSFKDMFEWDEFYYSLQTK